MRCRETYDVDDLESICFVSYTNNLYLHDPLLCFERIIPALWSLTNHSRAGRSYKGHLSGGFVVR